MSFLRRVPLWVRILVPVAAMFAFVANFVPVPIHSGSDTNQTASCTQPGKKIGDTCTYTEQTHGVAVIRRYVTTARTSGTLYAAQQKPLFDLRPGDPATIENLCRAAAVSRINADHPDYQTELNNVKADTCDPAQKAKDNGDFDTCNYDLRSGVDKNDNVIAFSPANIQKACAPSTKQKPAAYRLAS